MSSETDHPRQRTVAELLAAHGSSGPSGPSGPSGHRRRRRDGDEPIQSTAPHTSTTPVRRRHGSPPPSSPASGVPATGAQPPSPPRGVRSPANGLPAAGGGLRSPANGMPATGRGPRSPATGLPATGLPAAGQQSPANGLPTAGGGLRSPATGLPAAGGGPRSPATGLPAAGQQSPANGLPATGAWRTGPPPDPDRSGWRGQPTEGAPRSPAGGQPALREPRVRVATPPDGRPPVDHPTEWIPSYGGRRSHGRHGGPGAHRGVGSLPVVSRVDEADSGPPTGIGSPPEGAEAWHAARVGSPAPALDDRPAGLNVFDDDPDGESEPGLDTGPQRRLGRSAATSTGRAWAPVLAQWILGALGGAAIWVGFRYLWGNLLVVAVVAAVVVTVGLVVVVRSLLRNDDIRTTLLAVGVGLLLTASPAILPLLGR